MKLDHLDEDAKNLLSMMDNGTKKDITDTLKKAEIYVNLFCMEYNVRPLEITISSERGYYEPMFSFTDDLGSYNLDGIIHSLYSEN